jgi:hypothetical protein
MPNPARPPNDGLLRELVPVGKYRVRILEDAKTRERVLDIREYVNSSGSFSGFTRRGVRLSRAEVDLLVEDLRQATEVMGT